MIYFLRHESLSIFLRCARNLLSVLDHASTVFLLLGRKTCLRLGKKYVLCAGTVLKQKDLRITRRSFCFTFCRPSIDLACAVRQ